MQIIVDKLPYYEGSSNSCPYALIGKCVDADTDNCPAYWDKYKVMSDDNPHECCGLKEYEIAKKEIEGNNYKAESEEKI